MDKKIDNISDEQIIIVDNLISHNILVNSVAGSGKTTCNLYIAKKYHHMKILLLTYNSRLKIETRIKVNDLELQNIEVHSYHSFCVKYYDNKCYTDSVINEILNYKIKPIKNFYYDIIVCDETQDMNKTYYELVCKIYSDLFMINKIIKKPKICIFGDIKQSIFKFNNSDHRYITCASKIFNFNNYLWLNCTLSQSFRITHEMASFINNCLLKYEYIKSNKITNIKPRYLFCDSHRDPFSELLYYLNLGYKSNEIFILTPSLRSKSSDSPIVKLENKIKQNTNILVYVSTNDDGKIDEQLIKEKLVFATFHQTKGLERKVVIIFGFDNSYFKYYNRTSDKHSCPNELYVACTRASEQLSLIHDYKNNFIDFISIEHLNIYSNVIQYKNISKLFSNSKLLPSPFSPPSIIITDVISLIRHLPDNIILDCLNLININKINYSNSLIDIPVTISNGITHEAVSEITGVAIPAMYEFIISGKISIIDSIDSLKYKNIDLEHIMQFYFNYNSSIDINIPSDILSFRNSLINQYYKNILQLSNYWLAFNSGYIHKLHQIVSYDWLSIENLSLCINNLSHLNISHSSIFESPISFDFIPSNIFDIPSFSIKARLDCLDNLNNIVYEFKCVKDFSSEHYLQLAIYLIIFENFKLSQINNLNLQISKLIHNINKLNSSIISNFIFSTFSINDIIFYSDNHNNLFKSSIINLYKTKNYIHVINSSPHITSIPTDNSTTISIDNSISISTDISLTNPIDHVKTKHKICDKKKKVDIFDISYFYKYNDHNTKIIFSEVYNNFISQFSHEINEQQLILNKLKDELNKYQIKTKYILFNILSGIGYSIDIQKENFNKLLNLIVDTKYGKNNLIDDENFVNQTSQIYQKYIKTKKNGKI